MITRVCDHAPEHPHAKTVSLAAHHTFEEDGSYGIISRLPQLALGARLGQVDDVEVLLIDQERLEDYEQPCNAKDAVLASNRSQSGRIG